MRIPANAFEPLLAAQAWLGLRAAAALDGLEPLPGPDSGRPAVSVIVAVRDEERRLPRLLASLQPALQGQDEVIVVDDGSRDHTRAIAREFGATVVEAGRGPGGRRGRAHALGIGAQAAAHDWLLFLDPDAWLESDELIDRMLATGLPALSVFPRQETVSFAERLVVPFAYRHYLAGRRRLRTLSGHCVLVNRAAYTRAGGHNGSRRGGEATLARNLRRHGLRLTTMDGRRLLAVRLFEPARGPREGFGGSAAAFLRDEPLPGLIAAGSALLASLPLVAAVEGARRRKPGLALAGLVAWLADARAAHRFARALGGRYEGPSVALLQPLAQLAFVGLTIGRLFAPGRGPASRR